MVRGSSGTTTWANARARLLPRPLRRPAPPRGSSTGDSSATAANRNGSARSLRTDLVEVRRRGRRVGQLDAVADGEDVRASHRPGRGVIAMCSSHAFVSRTRSRAGSTPCRRAAARTPRRRRGSRRRPASASRRRAAVWAIRSSATRPSSREGCSATARPTVRSTSWSRLTRIAVRAALDAVERAAGDDLADHAALGLVDDRLGVVGHDDELDRALGDSRRPNSAAPTGSASRGAAASAPGRSRRAGSLRRGARRPGSPARVERPAARMTGSTIRLRIWAVCARS